MADDKVFRERTPGSSTAAAAAAISTPSTGEPGCEVAGQDASTTSAAPSSLTASPWDIEFELAQAVFYHRSRLAWLNGVQSTILFFNIFFGTAAASTFIPVTISGLLVALASAFALATKLPDQIRREAEQLQKCCDMAERLADSFDSATALALRKELVRLGGAEPTGFRAVETIAYNEAVGACRRDPAYLRQVKPHEYWLRHLWRFDGTDFPPRTGASETSNDTRSRPEMNGRT